MADFEEFVLTDGVRFGEPRDGHINVEGEIQCLGGITVTVEKKLKIVRGMGPTATVRTAEYSYNVRVEGRGNLFRYCAPDGYRVHHHVHRFDDDGRELPVEDIHYSDDIPHLSDVIEKARGVYFGDEV